jgi:hypothetical protein
MANDLSAVASVVQVFVGGKYEGTISDFSYSDPRPVSQTGMANGRNARGIGIAKPSVSFTRPLLKTSTGQQVSVEILNGPVDIDVIYPGSDQQWRLPNFQRTTHDTRHNPDSGSTSESFAGVCDKPVRVK